MVRIKHRYLLLNILYPDSSSPPAKSGAVSSDNVPYTVQFRQPSPDSLNGKILMRLIRDGVAHLFGDYGSGMIAGSLQIKYFSAVTSTAIIRVAREHYRLVWAALTFTTRLPQPVDRQCVIQVIRVSGTIKKAEEEAIRRAKATIKRARYGMTPAVGGALATAFEEDDNVLPPPNGTDISDSLSDSDGQDG